MKVADTYILNLYKEGRINREVAYELLQDMGYSEEIIETRLDLAIDDRYNTLDVIREIIEEEKAREFSIIHSSMVDDMDIKEILLRFSRKLLNNT